MRRGITVAAIAGVLALTATACGGNDGGSGDSSGKKAAEDPQSVSGSITWWDTSNEAEGPTYDKLVAAFQKEYPKIKVDRTSVSFDQAEQKFKTAAQSGKGAPDVIRTDVGWSAGFANLGYLQPLDGTPALDNVGDFLPGPLSTAKWNGETVGVPQVTDTLGLLYNKEVFQEAGIAKPPATWDEFIATAKKIKQKTGVTGTMLNPEGYFSLPFLYGEGADMLDVEGKKITVASPEGVKAMETALQLTESDVALKPATTDGYVAAQTAFKDGKVAMIVNGPWSVSDSYGGKAFKNKDNLGIANIPAGSTGKAAAPIGGHNYSVYRGSGNKDAAYLFVKFMSSAKSQELTAKEINTLPTRTSAYTAAVTADPAKKAFQQALSVSRSRPVIPGVGDLFVAFDQHYVKILRGDVSPEDGLKALAKEWNTKLLKDYTVG
ncbi:extracellular solute-binding protein [Streptomyces clavuligerus]|uniref:Carbohydrate ABC transporter substrate-binding protein, CUT1 family n=1 Tax=Streptomyces clavuligerus TaxID=1901 RepID=B5GXE3_STRCL|nr:extracellular solute-binding protein [Streptomyces clavuligerus]ANW20494.1 sugar ABC transporter substrate-binding protein [Streptomyces clavuligerus]AXU15121.1 extracellular solute-binding protein [Streptomyces clavuligerus]EDY50989.1 extracellular solute-binding protein family 1 [Streptomyces clavuligerus]EFG06525.1 Carbohydrate ABC transporter substrate-binding protein, CUT1 family [Streptomyces clavuligerus]MBY6305184.1 extracellular solute-binding protein [Streptomyces clavuligerus]